MYLFFSVNLSCIILFILFLQACKQDDLFRKCRMVDLALDHNRLRRLLLSAPCFHAVFA